MVVVWHLRLLHVPGVHLGRRWSAAVWSVQVVDDKYNDDRVDVNDFYNYNDDLNAFVNDVRFQLLYSIL